SDVDLREHRVRGAAVREDAQVGAGWAGRDLAAPRGAVGRSEGQARRQWAQPLGRAAAASVHCTHRRGAARGDPVRRAVLGARSDLDRQDRGVDRRAQGRLHDRDRHPQHAAGGARLRLHRLHVSRGADRVRHHEQDVHRAQRLTLAGLYHRPLRLDRSLARTKQMVISDHTAKAFDVDLQELTRMVAEMGGLAEKQVADAVDALAHRDTDRAQQTVAADPDIDALQAQIEERAVLTIARRQPMAVDLREVVGALRVSNDLERIGDLAKNIGKRVLALDGEFHPAKLIRGVEHMGSMVLAQLKDVLDSYARHDLKKALAVWNGDEEVDSICTSLFRELLDRK